MNYVNTLKKVFLTAGIILLLPIVLSASVFAERRQIEGYGSYFLMFSEIEDEELDPYDQRINEYYDRLK